MQYAWSVKAQHDQFSDRTHITFIMNPLLHYNQYIPIIFAGEDRYTK